MMKNRLLPLFLGVGLMGLILSVSLPFFVKGQEVKIESKRVEYDLPYAGILPGHPLFFLKTWRDKLLDFAARDQLKKANLYLLFADKRIRMAIELSEKGKWEYAVTAVSEGEGYFLKIPELLERSKKQGASAEGSFILKLKTAVEKHREVIEGLSKNAPQGQRQNLAASLKMNKLIKDRLSPL